MKLHGKILRLLLRLERKWWTHNYQVSDRSRILMLQRP